MTNATPEELRAALGAGGVTLVDVREFPEHAAGHIPGARWVPLRQISARAAEIDRSKPVFVACQAGVRSLKAGQVLLDLGFPDVRNVAGGFAAWQAAGFPVERVSNPPWPLERQVRLTAGLMIALFSLLAYGVDLRFTWLAAFMGAGLAFAALTNSCAMAMLMARMPWNQGPRGSTPPVGAGR